MRRECTTKESTYPRMVDNVNDIRQFEIYQINNDNSECGTPVVVITPTNYSSNVIVVPFSKSKHKFRFDLSRTLSKERLLNGVQMVDICSQEEINILTRLIDEYMTWANQ